MRVAVFISRIVNTNFTDIWRGWSQQQCIDKPNSTVGPSKIIVSHGFTEHGRHSLTDNFEEGLLKNGRYARYNWGVSKTILQYLV